MFSQLNNLGEKKISPFTKETSLYITENNYTSFQLNQNMEIRKYR